MKALLLNSGVGKRMGALTQDAPKCMAALKNGETILSRQIRLLEQAGVKEIVTTTGPFAGVLQRHAKDTARSARLSFVHNPRYAETNYIYSIYLAKEQLRDDILMLHGDLVFSFEVLERMIGFSGSAMAVSSTLPLPGKDFKAVVEHGKISAVGIEFFQNAITAQPCYRLSKQDWLVWLGQIQRFVEDGQTGCYAESAFNRVSGQCALFPMDIKDKLCTEVDTPEDLSRVNKLLDCEQ